MQKTGARQYSRGRFHLLLPAVRVTTQGRASEGGGNSRATRGPCGVDPVRRLRLSASTQHERRLARWKDHSTASGALSMSVGVIVDGGSVTGAPAHLSEAARG